MNKNSDSILDRSFFMRDPLIAARELLGWTLCFNECEGIIVETEAYAGIGDPACHTFKRPSARNFVERYPAGTAYVYLNYGVHWLFNVLVKGATPEQHGFVLIRGIKPLQGMELMKQRRLSKSQLPSKKELSVCDGPGKLTQAFGINQSHHGIDLFDNPAWKFKKNASFQNFNIMETPRIGISQARERLWRFVLSASFSLTTFHFLIAQETSSLNLKKE